MASRAHFWETQYSRIRVKNGGAPSPTPPLGCSCPDRASCGYKQEVL